MSSNIERQQRRQQQQQAETSKQLQNFAISYPIEIKFPANVISSPDKEKPIKKPLRSDVNLIQHRLLESGVLFTKQSFEEISKSLSIFIENLESTDCFESIQTHLEYAPSDNEEEKTNPCDLSIHLKEKPWYKVYVGGGLKHESMEQSMSSSFLPKVQFESSAYLRNIRGYLDQTSASYTMDQNRIPMWRIQHTCPLYTILNYDLRLYLLERYPWNGSQIQFTAEGCVNTLDYSATRGYQEFIRGFQCRAESSTPKHYPTPKLSSILEWTCQLRDLLPRRSTKVPYACLSGVDVLTQSVPNLKHSVRLEQRCDATDRPCDPTRGYRYSQTLEVAGPPGDVGFVKYHMGGIGHASAGNITVSASLYSGMMRSFSFGGLCGEEGGRTRISDRFFVGGPMQLRGFLPAGVGPRSRPVAGSSSPGDALGGELFYTSSLSASIPIQTPQPNNTLNTFFYINAGSLSSWNTPTPTLLRTSRISVGAGLVLNTPLGRMEGTYSIPLRYGPRDNTKNVQFGFGMVFES